MNISNSQIVSIFGDALECKTDEERRAFLDRACRGDGEARAQIEALLQAHGEAGGFLQDPAASPSAAQTTDSPHRSMAGELVGPYKLLEEIELASQNPERYRGEYSKAQAVLIENLLAQGKFDDMRLLDETDADRPSLATRMEFVQVLSRAGRFKEAAKALDGIDENESGWEYERALLYLQTGQPDAYRRLCRTSLKRATQTDDAWAGIQCKLAPHALVDYTPVLNWMEELVRTKPQDRLCLGLQAHFLYRSGHAEAAAKQLEQLVSSDEVASTHQPFNKFFLAMAHHDLGHDAEAERYFREAADWIDKNGQAELREGAVLSKPLDWSLRLDLKILRAEAEQLLGILQTPKAMVPKSFSTS